MGGVARQDQAAYVDGLEGLVVREPLVYIGGAKFGTVLDDDGPNRVVAVLLLDDVHPGLLAGTCRNIRIRKPAGARRLAHRQVMGCILEGGTDDKLLELSVVGPPGIVV